MSLLGVDSLELDNTFLLDRVRVLGLSTATGVPSVARFPMGVFGPLELGLPTTTGVPGIDRLPTGVLGPFFILFGDGVFAGDLAAVIWRT